MAARFNCSGFRGENCLAVATSSGDLSHLLPFWGQDQIFWQIRTFEDDGMRISFHCRWLKPLLQGRWRCNNTELGVRLADGRRKTLVMANLGLFSVACRAIVLSAVALQLRIAVSVLIAVRVTLESTNNTKEVTELKRKIIWCYTEQNH